MCRIPVYQRLLLLCKAFTLLLWFGFWQYSCHSSVSVHSMKFGPSGWCARELTLVLLLRFKRNLISRNDPAICFGNESTYKISFENVIPSNVLQKIEFQNTQLPFVLIIYSHIQHIYLKILHVLVFCSASGNWFLK
jgi:hypothetical protein